MIWESSFWKDDLVKVAGKLVKRTIQKRWPERSLASLEKDVFVSFYAIRKLIESKKISDGLLSLKIPVIGYPSTIDR